MPKKNSFPNSVDMGNYCFTFLSFLRQNLPKLKINDGYYHLTDYGFFIPMNYYLSHENLEYASKLLS
jgi:hypothetical protein